MKNKKALIVMSETHLFASDLFAVATGYDCYLSYGTVVPDVSGYESVAWWMAGGMAARLPASMRSTLKAPGQEWLSGLDRKWLQRDIVTGPVTSIPEDGQVWLKVAEAKIDSVKPGIHDRASIESLGLPENTLFQWTHDVLNLNHEHRFFTANGIVHTGSPYLVDGVVYPGLGFTSPYTDEAQEFASHVASSLGDDFPTACTLDVARDENSGEWLIVEVNPAWSSGLYASNPAKVLQVLNAACNGEAGRWQWKPADYLLQAAQTKQVTVVEAETEANGLFLKQ